MVERHVPGGRLSAFLDDELAEPDALAITRHVGGCDRCLDELSSLRTTRDALRALPGLHAPVLTAGVEGRTRRPGWLGRGRRLAAITGSVSLLVLAVYVMGEEPGGVEPTTELFVVEHVARTVGGSVPSPAGGGDR